MIGLRRFLKYSVTAAGFLAAATGVWAQENDRLEELFAMLREPDLPNWQMVEEQIWAEWSRSGSPSADLLLKRGREALDEENVSVAIDHFTALIDHAPDFAEGYNARATAYFHADLFGPSLEDIRMTLALNPRHFGAMTGLGTILEHLGESDAALKAYVAASEINPHDPDLQKAVKRLEKAVAGATL